MSNVSESRGNSGPATNLELATFFIGRACYGIDILAVQEINKLTGLTPVPLAPPYVTGVLNLRGRIVTIIDLAMRVGAPSGYASDHGHIIMVDYENEFVGLKVDGIGDVLSTSWDHVESPPANLTDAHRTYVRGVLKIKDRLVEILDLDAVLALE